MLAGSNKIAAIINVTPLIDVLLVLLIVFMLLPSQTKGLKSEVPQPAPESQSAPPNPHNLVLRIQQNMPIELNYKPVLLAQFQTLCHILSTISIMADNM